MKTGSKPAVTLSVTDGTFTGDKAAIQAASATQFVTGGEFSSKVDDTYVPMGQISELGNDGNYHIVTDTTTVAVIGMTRYTTLQAAVDAADDGDKIELQQNVNLDQQVKISGKAITLDLKGKNISGDVDDLLTINSGADLSVEDTVGGGAGFAAHQVAFGLFHAERKAGQGVGNHVYP